MGLSVRSYRVSLRLYVVFSLLMAVSAAASGLLLLYLARPFISELGGQLAVEATAMLFGGAGLAGAAAAVGGLVVGLRFASRIRVIVKKAEALSPALTAGPEQHVTDELGALDAVVGRLTLSVDQFIRDSDILSRLPEGMLLLLPTDELLSFNATSEVVLGLSLERFRGVPILSPAGVFPLGKGNEALARLLGEATARQHSVRMSEVSVTCATGQELVLEITVQHREWGSNSTAVVLLFRDASEKQRIREEIKRTDQLALLGGMAARVAHQIRTPLATIRGLLELLQADLVLEGSSKDYMERIIHAVDRQDRLVDNLLTLSHPEPESCQAVSIPALIADVLDGVPADARIHVNSEAAPAPAWGDAFRLSEVFMNLIQNALEATPTDGVVEICMEPGAPGWVRVSVRNTGVGIPAELKDRIFQPFFTTKSRGTGLGLAIARQIVEAHRGHLSMTSDGVSETTFAVDLPAAPVVAAASREESLRGDRG
jgi:two-component system, NtrC family, sensor histidine kinase AtoS